MTLNPDDPTPPYQQVANRLRASIRTQGLRPGDKLPSQHELAIQYGVARMTIQQALRVLRDEGLVITRQGSGAFVKAHSERPVDLRPQLQAAFTAPEVTIDFCGFTAETLVAALMEPLDRVRSGELHPRSVSIRLLLPDTTAPLSLPVIADRPPQESAPARERLAGITQRSLQALTAAMTELSDFKLLNVAKVETRLLLTAPQVKTFIINDEDVFQGYYPVRRREVKLSSGTVEIFDPMGKDAALFHYAKDTDAESLGSLFVESTRSWFDSLWTTIATPA